MARSYSGEAVSGAAVWLGVIVCPPRCCSVGPSLPTRSVVVVGIESAAHGDYRVYN
jgi:hypothetical protein